jgi:isocitrate dehydrogenase kinase/phosphatase
MQHHADLLSRDFWHTRKERIVAGHIEDVFPYPQQIRFCNQIQATAIPAVALPPYLENLNNE